MIRFGASFSAPYARYLGLNPKVCMSSAVKDLGVHRFRLMSYWNQIESVRGDYDFRELDWQIDLAEKYDAEVTLCLGLRQPRWPESHWPDWALDLPDAEWQEELMEFIEAVVVRYKDRKCIVSYQLENEALNRSFGEHGNFDRARLKREFALVKKLDPDLPCIMTTSNSWGIPLFGPRPDRYGFSIYRYFYQKDGYKKSFLTPGFFRLRAFIIRLVQLRGSYIHELQAEPWGPKGIPDMTIDEQFKSINPDRVKEAVNFAKKTKLYQVDLWGLEWWYYLRTKHKLVSTWNYMRTVYNSANGKD